MKYEYKTCTARDHAQTRSESAWFERDHEEAMLAERGEEGWVLSAVRLAPDIPIVGGHLYYFHRPIVEQQDEI